MKRKQQTSREFTSELYGTSTWNINQIENRMIKLKDRLEAVRKNSGVKNYVNNAQGTIDYTTGAIILNSLNIASISNIRGLASTVVELTVTPNSNDIVPVRDQIVEIDISNSKVKIEADTFVGGSSTGGVGYTTTKSY